MVGWLDDWLELDHRPNGHRTLVRCWPPNLALHSIRIIFIQAPVCVLERGFKSTRRSERRRKHHHTIGYAATHSSMIQRPRRRWPSRLAAPMLVALGALSTVTASASAAVPAAAGKAAAPAAADAAATPSGPVLPDKELYRVTELPGVPMEEWGLAPMYAGYMPVETAGAKGGNGTSDRPTVRLSVRPTVRLSVRPTGCSWKSEGDSVDSPRTLRVRTFQAPPPTAGSRRAGTSSSGCTSPRPRPPTPSSSGSTAAPAAAPSSACCWSAGPSASRPCTTGRTTPATPARRTATSARPPRRPRFPSSSATISAGTATTMCSTWSSPSKVRVDRWWHRRVGCLGVCGLVVFTDADPHCISNIQSTLSDAETTHKHASQNPIHTHASTST